MTTRFIPGEANGVKVTGRRGSVTVSVSASAEARAPLAVKLAVLGIRVLIQSLEDVLREARMSEANYSPHAGEPLCAIFGPLAEDDR